MGVYYQLPEYSQILDWISSTPDIMRRAQAGEELTADEDWQYFLLFSANVRFWENIHYQYRQDLFDDAEFAAELSSLFDEDICMR